MDRDSGGPGHKVYSNRKDESSFSTAGSRIKLLRDHIFQTWLERVFHRTGAAANLGGLAISPLLPDFLDRMIEMMNHSEPDSQLKAMEKELNDRHQEISKEIPTEISVSHFKNVVEEFQILQETILDVLELKDHLDPEERNLILKAISLGIQAAAIETAEALSRAVQEPKQRLEEAANQQSWLQALLERIPLAVILVDPFTGKVIFSNNEASRLTGTFPIQLVSEEIGGYYASDAHGQRIPLSEMPRYRISRGEKIKNFEITWHRNGKSSPLLINGELIPAMFNHPPTALLILQDITDQVAARKALQRSEEHFRALADTLPQLVWTARQDGSIDYFNKRWVEYTGVPETSDANEAWLSLVHPEDRSETAHVWKLCLQTGKALTREHRIRTKSGGYHWFLVLAEPIYGPDGEVIKWFGTCTDIDEQKKFSESLEKAKSLAEAASASKSSFLANVSHEIRTPLGAIMGFTDLLKDASLDWDEKKEYLEVIERNGQALTRILDDVLDLSKVEAGHLKIENTNFSLYSLLEETMTLFQDRAESKGLKFEKIVLPQTPDRVNSDPTRLRQILVNIIGNAIKFTSQGEVKVQVEAEAETNPNYLFKIHVIDTGPGLSQEQAELLFQPFTQADNSVTRQFGGTGLGLALSRRLAQALGGDVRISKCTPQVGCTFTITFSAQATEPVTRPVSRQQTAISNAPNHGRLANARILVVDDSSDNRLLINQFLKREGALIEEASNGMEALEQALQSDFDLVLMDIQMPVLDGHRAVQKLRECGYHKPVLALTAHAMKEEMEKALSSGFDDYLTKPLNLKTLIEKVSQFSKTSHH